MRGLGAASAARDAQLSGGEDDGSVPWGKTHEGYLAKEHGRIPGIVHRPEHRCARCDRKRAEESK